MMTLTPAKRFMVRTALVTGTTLATVFGAQSLAMLEQLPLSHGAANIQQAVPDLSQTTNNTLAASDPGSAAPSIVILRHSSQSAAVVSGAGTARAVNIPSQAGVILPPSPVQVLPPQPMTLPVMPQTRSSR